MQLITSRGEHVLHMSGACTCRFTSRLQLSSRHDVSQLGCRRAQLNYGSRLLTWRLLGCAAHDPLPSPALSRCRSSRRTSWGVSSGCACCWRCTCKGGRRGAPPGAGTWTPVRSKSR